MRGSWGKNIETAAIPLLVKGLKSSVGAITFLSLIFLATTAFAQDENLSAADLKKLSVEELMNIEVTLVSRTPQKLTEAASAVQVITGDDIRRSGATNVPEALRLVTNLQVAQLNSNAYIISSRGFNTIFANKLLVMIDGRTVYTPLFGGVLWELQNVLLEDVDRIEVISGPGGTLWGANAVNGVINIVTKSSKETQGLYASALGGTFVKDKVALRYGDKIGKNLTYKVYGQHYDRGPTTLANGTDNTDAWRSTQAGFKMDWDDSTNAYTVQGDYYAGTKKTAGSNSDFNGENVLARWSKTFSEKSDLMLQFYYDRYSRNDVPGLSSDELKTADLDFQYRFPLAKRHSILTGAGYRMVKDNAIFRTPNVGILPEKKNLDLFNAFVQDDITVSDRLKVTIGSKVSHNVYTQFEFQPSARAALTIRTKNTLWAAVSRAVRTPSRLDVDYFLPKNPRPPTSPSVAGGPNFVSEKLVAYELGYRLQPTPSSTFSISTFYNVYTDVYSVEALPGTLTYQIQNGSEGKSWGAELAATFQLTGKWKIRGGYTYFDKKLKAKPGHTFDPTYLGNDAMNQALLQSITDIGKHLHFDLIARYLDYLPKTLATVQVPGYFTFDARVAYTIKSFEISVVGQNLYEKNHTEFDALNIPRSAYAKLTLRL